jgi:bifunctional non-homologous end joining protein LigD
MFCISIEMEANIPFRVSPMLATLVAKPFDEPGWVYEEKYDGIRILAYKEGSRVTLLTRNNIERSESFQRITRVIRELQPKTLVLDGEVIVLDQKNISRFQLLQRGGADALYAAFDCLFLNGRDLRREPLSYRREALEKSIAGSDELILSRRLAETGKKAFQIAKQQGYEGLVAKRVTSLYVSGRSRDWIKVKANQQDEFIIVGYTEPSGSRQNFGALLLGAYSGRKLRYVGRVGTGFNQKNLASLFRKFQALKLNHPTVEDVRGISHVTFVAPRLIAQIAYTEWTSDRKLRHPVFLGLRDDKDASEVLLPKV